MDIDEIMEMLKWTSKKTQRRGRKLARNIRCINVFLRPSLGKGGRSKVYWDNCAIILAERSDEELRPYLPELVEWLEDMNWPGSERIYYRLMKYKTDDSFRNSVNEHSRLMAETMDFPNDALADVFLKANIDDLSLVADWMLKIDHDPITLQTDKTTGCLGEGFLLEVERNGQNYNFYPIPNEIKSHIKPLYKAGIWKIERCRDHVNFTMWSVMDESRGIVFSRSGTEPDREDVSAGELAVDNWYYYSYNYYKATDLYSEKLE